MIFTTKESRRSQQTICQERRIPSFNLKFYFIFCIVQIVMYGSWWRRFNIENRLPRRIGRVNEKDFSQFLTLTDQIDGRRKGKKKSSIRKQTKTHIRIYPHNVSWTSPFFFYPGIDSIALYRRGPSSAMYLACKPFRFDGSNNKRNFEKKTRPTLNNDHHRRKSQPTD